MPDRGDKELPDTVVQNVEKAQRMALVEDPYRTTASFAKKAGYDNIAEALLQKAEESVQKEAKQYDSIDAEAIKQAEMIAGLLAKGEEAIGDYQFMVNADSKDSFEVLKRVYAALGVSRIPGEEVPYFRPSSTYGPSDSKASSYYFPTPMGGFISELHENDRVWGHKVKELRNNYGFEDGIPENPNIIVVSINPSPLQTGDLQMRPLP